MTGLRLPPSRNANGQWISASGKAVNNAASAAAICTNDFVNAEIFWRVWIETGFNPLGWRWQYPRVPRVTIIIATYNRSGVLRYAIDSVLRQTFTDFELLVIGDGCTDDSQSVVTGYLDPRVRWIGLAENSGHQSTPNNEGLRQARGEVIAYLGHDDLWLPHHLSSMLETLDGAGCDVAYGLCMNVAPDETSAWPCVLDPSLPLSPPSCMAHRRSVTDQIGGWHLWTDLPADTPPEIDLWRRARTAGCKFVFTQRLSTIKFPAAWRRDCYRLLPSHEQAAWLERIRSEPQLETRLLMGFVVTTRVPSGLPYAALVRYFIDQTLSRLRRRWSMRTSRFGLRSKTHHDIAAARQYKGL